MPRQAKTQDSPTIPEATLHAIVERLRSRSSTVKHESRGLGFNNNKPLRDALCSLIGRDEYFALLPRGGGGVFVKGEGSGAVRPTLLPRPDDSGLPLVASMSKDEGWSWRHVAEHAPVPLSVKMKDGGSFRVMDTGERILIMIAPDGREYVQAGPYEKADLLRTNPIHPEGPPSRFMFWERSTLYRASAKVEKDTARFTEHVDHKLGKKKAAVVTPAPEPEPTPVKAIAKKTAAKKPAAKAVTKKPAAKAVTKKPAAKKAKATTKGRAKRSKGK